MKKIFVGAVILIAGLCMLSAPCVFAQDVCEGNFDCDQDVDGSDAAVFKSDFGRSPFSEPCDTCNDSPCPCSPCPAGLTDCNSTCVNTNTDEDNCGGCANTCDSGELCVSGTCDVNCQAGLTNCGGTCVDTDTDESNCGGCANPCVGDQICVSGACVCPGDLSYCAGQCRDLQTDEEYCGFSCGSSVNCVFGEMCDNGTCTLNCPSGLTKCGSICVDADTDEDNCGGCANTCDSGEMCVSGSCEIYCSDNYAPVEKTGQTTSYATGDDGDLETGVAWPNPRFTDNSDGTVTDNLTGLIWLKNADCFGMRTWNDALSDSNGLEDGECGLTDGSGPGDWRLPNLFELESLRDMGHDSPALPTGHLFQNVQNGYYRSSTTVVRSNHETWNVDLFYGVIEPESKTISSTYVWPVRGGQ